VKNNLLLVLFSLLSTLSFGQKIHFTDVTNQWNCLFSAIYHHDPTSHINTYTYSDSTYIGGKLYLKLGDSYYVYEDTASKKVFARAIVSGIPDTADILLYDYNWKVNDTIKIKDERISWVSHVSSTTINGIDYKVWYFQGELGPPGPTYYYNVIEGIGCTNRFDFPINLLEGVEANQLVCFANNGDHPVLSNAVPSYGAITSDFTANFRNTDDCPLSVSDNLVKARRQEIFPNPVEENSKIIFPFEIRSGKLIICNNVGQTIFSTTFQNKNEILFGNKIYVPGIYYYRVMDNQSSQVFSGKFIKE
jgi:hypothetical protein